MMEEEATFYYCRSCRWAGLFHCSDPINCSGMHTYKLSDCLHVDPFEGDFGDGEYCFSDKIVTAAKEHVNACHCCGGSIPKGQKHRARREAYDGSAATTRWCYDCSLAMAQSNYDDGEAWEKRINLCREDRIRLAADKATSLAEHLSLAAPLARHYPDPKKKIYVLMWVGNPICFSTDRQFFTKEKIKEFVDPTWEGDEGQGTSYSIIEWTSESGSIYDGETENFEILLIPSKDEYDDV